MCIGCVCVCECVCVDGGVGGAGGRKEGADTELKQKPHTSMWALHHSTQPEHKARVVRHSPNLWFSVLYPHRYAMETAAV